MSPYGVTRLQWVKDTYFGFYANHGVVLEKGILDMDIK